MYIQSKGGNMGSYIEYYPYEKIPETKPLTLEDKFHISNKPKGKAAIKWMAQRETLRLKRNQQWK